MNIMAKTNETIKRRDAARTRQALLVAAQELFGTRGYAATTLREIGEHAGVDPALIARYFGNKAAIYIASLEANVAPLDEMSGQRRVFDGQLIERMIERTTRAGASPVLQAAVGPADDPIMKEAARRILTERTVDPLQHQVETAGLDRPRLRAELIAAALTGIVLARSAGTFQTLGNATNEDVVELTLQAINRMLEP